MVDLGDEVRPQHRLIRTRNCQRGEKKYFLTNAEREIGIQRVLVAALVRWNVEHVFRVAKSEVGLTHYEGLSYVSLKRHWTLCQVVLTFVALQTESLREKNSEVTLEQVCRRGGGFRKYLCQGGATETTCLFS